MFPEFPSKINIFSEKDSEMDSEMSSCCCFLLRLLFVQKTAHARGGCQGASGFVHSDLFDVGGYPFFEANLELFFSQKNAILKDRCFQNEPTMKSFGSYFWKKCENGKVCFDCAGAYGLHMSPSHGALRATQKSKKKGNLFENRFF